MNDDLMIDAMMQKPKEFPDEVSCYAHREPQPWKMS